MEAENKAASKAVGRPRLIKSPQEFDERVDTYIDWCRAQDKPILLTGLILALGFNSKDTFYSYENYPEFTDSVKRARLLIEMEYEQRLNTANSATGPIFALKNFGWTDKQEVDVTTGGDKISTAPTAIQIVGVGDDDSTD